MIMLLGIPYLKSNIHKRVKTFEAPTAKICTRSQTQTIKSALQAFTRRQ